MRVCVGWVSAALGRLTRTPDWTVLLGLACVAMTDLPTSALGLKISSSHLMGISRTFEGGAAE